MRGRVADVIICFKFYRIRLRGFRVVRGQKMAVFHWLLTVVLITGQHYRAALWLPSNLRPTTRECVHLVMHRYSRSHNEDRWDGHLICHSQKDYMLHANFTAVCVTVAELLPMGFSICREVKLSRHAVLRCGNACCWLLLLLWPWPWPDDLHIRTLPVLPRDTPDVQWTSYVHSICHGWTISLLLWPWPNDLHIWTWPVFSGDTPDVQIRTFCYRLVVVVV